MDLVLPGILLILLIWLVMRTRPNRDEAAGRSSAKGTAKLTAGEDEKRREGTDGL